MTTLTKDEVRALVASVASSADNKALGYDCVDIRWSLHLPGIVNKPFVLRNSVVEGGLFAESTVFKSIIDLTGSTVMGPAMFSAAEFERTAAFYSAVFVGPAMFAGADFGAPADFTSAAFLRKAVFDDAQLADQSRFTSATFDRLASFLGVHFGGTDFSDATFIGDAQFNLSTARGDLGFQSACFQHPASFRMRITEVVRGADLLKSTARQLLLLRALDISPPAYYHADLVTDERGLRLAKRHDALSIRALRDAGKSPQEVRALWEAKVT